MKLMKASVAMLLMMAMVAVADDAKMVSDKPWFDMKNCAFCKEFAKEPGLMENTRVEYHNLQNGILSVMYVDKAYEDEMANAVKGMEAVVATMGEGKPMPPMCEHCAVYGQFHASGQVKFEEIKSETNYITVMTSTDPAMVTRLQAFGKRNNEEHKKFEESMKAQKTQKMGAK